MTTESEIKWIILFKQLLRLFLKTRTVTSFDRVLFITLTLRQRKYYTHNFMTRLLLRCNNWMHYYSCMIKLPIKYLKDIKIPINMFRYVCIIQWAKIKHTRNFQLEKIFNNSTQVNRSICKFITGVTWFHDNRIKINSWI